MQRSGVLSPANTPSASANETNELFGIKFTSDALLPKLLSGELRVTISKPNKL